MNKLQKIIFILFAILIFFVPSILWPFTSEVFEFNKMVLVYGLTTLITGAWIIRMIVERKFIFRRTILDIPLLLFLGSQLISTILSIDPLTSWLGYYSRFNGGLVSVICYSLLYWAWVSNFGAKQTLNLVKIWLVSGALVAIYGVLEHFGIDKSIWVQDVQSRVFSTLGQPNWLAAWLVALIPLTWANAISNAPSAEVFQFPISDEFSKLKFRNFLIYFGLSILFFWTLIFTKSRSGFLGFGVTGLVFWGLTAWTSRKEIKKITVPFLAIGLSVLIICLVSGTQWTPSLGQLIHKQSTVNINQQSVTSGSTALETGGTESGIIRKIVWDGAIQIWIHYPIFGTGVETFAYSYYKFRPAVHNMTSEWDFIYNKAHNEFLNVAANSGTVGLLSYLALIAYTVVIFIKTKPGEIKIMNIALLAGFASLAATNFFGFSVVPTQLQFFLFPAIAIGLSLENKSKKENKKAVATTQNIFVGFVLLASAYSLFTIGKYWYADTLYAKGKAYNGITRPDLAVSYLTRAVSLEPVQPLFHIELANSYRTLALAYYQKKDTGNTTKYTGLTIDEAETAISESPANVNLKRSLFGIYITLSTINQNYLFNARDTLVDAVTLAPTDAKLYYNLGLVYARVGQLNLAISTLKTTIELKADYREARLAYAILLIDNKQNAEAKTQLEYILKNIDPNDSLTKQTLESIK